MAAGALVVLLLCEAIEAQPALALAALPGAERLLLVQPDGSVLDAITGRALAPSGDASVVPGRIPGLLALRTRSTAPVGDDPFAGVVVVPARADLTPAGTFAIWFKLDAAGTGGDGWIFRYEVLSAQPGASPGDLQLRYWRSGVLFAGFELFDGVTLVDARVAFDPRSAATQALLPGFAATGWHFYAMTWTRGQPVSLFVDGVLVGTSGAAVPLTAASDARTFSVGGWPGAYAANGAFSEAQLYGAPLLPAVIAQRADRTRVVTPFLGEKGAALCLRIREAKGDRDGAKLSPRVREPKFVPCAELAAEHEPRGYDGRDHRAAVPASSLSDRPPFAGRPMPRH